MNGAICNNEDGRNAQKNRPTLVYITQRARDTRCATKFRVTQLPFTLLYMTSCLCFLLNANGDDDDTTTTIMRCRSNESINSNDVTDYKYEYSTTSATRI